MKQRHIHWFPGHMAKAHRVIREQLKLVDVVVELLDARIPRGSANPLLTEWTTGKQRLIVLNKADLADPALTEEWLRYFKAQGFTAIALDSSGKKNIKPFIHRIEEAGAVKVQKLAAKGIRNHPVRAMILGVPNVGKSSLINRLLGAATVRTGDKAGVTRGQQWLKIGKSVELLDMPGVLWPRMDDQDIAILLALTGALNDDIYDMELVIGYFLSWMREHQPQFLAERYKLELPLPEDPEEILRQIAVRRGCLRAGGIVDLEKARRIVLGELRDGKLGRLTLEYPPLQEQPKELPTE
ncbi:ribosome biogenesis GTPase YlqF [Anaeromusa acidaminophila]|uniref:ribosome biogenesis GTPase YlqF n=1 Tax=Anaeromusa acidaminophila TaxID=81464 RepID=UPI00036FDE1E|nr:ribosome biogenesis GTPase YlqF [Anaeromusa acidaminophila]